MDVAVAVGTIFIVVSGAQVWVGMSSFWAFGLAALGGAILDLFEAIKVQ